MQNNDILRKMLLVVESPTKAKTIKKFFGSDFPVVSSMGHVIDLPKSKLGVDLEKGFEPQYQTIRGKGKVITEIKRVAKKEDGVLMATDPDREGEAIAWHLANALDLPKEKIGRIVFHEITKNAINDAMQKQKKIDKDLVDAQQARRILDRLVGYKLSPFLWKKIRYGLSAGRVQSVAVRLVVERERERDAFESKTYWAIRCFAGQDKPKDVERLAISEAKKTENTKALKDEAALWVFKVLAKGASDKFEEDKEWAKKKIEFLPDTIKVESVESIDGKVSPPPPFMTSTLQRAAFNLYGFSAKRTMRLAQRLYEAGHVTYMRTDSVKLSKIALKNIRSWIEENLGKKYLPKEARFYRTRQKLAQEAHEAIRPTRFKQETLSGKFNQDHKKLYSLIRARTIASQCEQAKVKRWTVKCSAKEDKLLGKHSELMFDGFYKVSGVPKQFKDKKTFIPTEDEVLNVHRWTGVEGHVPPPPRYTEASLVKELEKNGIGRPSTYASIIDTIINRGYVQREDRALAPTDNGYVVNDLLAAHFPKIVDLKFTAGMEDKLDDIAEGKAKWKKVLADFYDPFIKNLERKEKEVNKEDIVVLEESDEKCPTCGGPMVVRLGKYGKFLSCKKFPECKGMKPFEEDAVGDEFWEKYEAMEKCPECGGPMTIKTGRFGKFWACEKYPECKITAPLLLKEKCPQCGSSLVERKSRRGSNFIGCSGYPGCRFIKKDKK